MAQRYRPELHIKVELPECNIPRWVQGLLMVCKAFHVIATAARQVIDTDTSLDIYSSYFIISDISSCEGRQFLRFIGILDKKVTISSEIRKNAVPLRIENYQYHAGKNILRSRQRAGSNNGNLRGEHVAWGAVPSDGTGRHRCQGELRPHQGRSDKQRIQDARDGHHLK